MSKNKSKKNKEETSEGQTFSQNKVFVMTRPSEENGGTLSIQTQKDAKVTEEIQELYSLAFFDYIMNLSGILNKTENELALKLITPTIAYQFFLEDPEHAQGIVNSFLQENNKSKGISFIKQMPDAVSQLEFILKENFFQFAKDYQKIGLEKTLQKHHHFYVDMEEIFFSLPACYCFNLIDFCEKMIKFKKKVPRKSK